MAQATIAIEHMCGTVLYSESARRIIWGNLVDTLKADCEAFARAGNVAMQKGIRTKRFGQL